MKRENIIKFFPFLILLLGFFSPVAVFFGSYNAIVKIIYSVSPRPIVFSERPGFVRRFDSFYFEFTDRQGKIEERTFSKNFYKNLKGPHRNKLVYFSMLTRRGLIQNELYMKAYNKFLCEDKMLLKTFKLSKDIVGVKIKLGKGVVRDFKCSSNQ